MPVREHGAQRASSTRSHRLTVFALAAALVAGLGAMATPSTGVGRDRHEGRHRRRPRRIADVRLPGTARSSYATQARSYGAQVTEIYSPYATWSKVKAAAQGANLFIYLGHGNGWPSPYAPFSETSKDGHRAQRAASGNGNSNTKYCGEYYIGRDIDLAPTRSSSSTGCATPRATPSGGRPTRPRRPPSSGSTTTAPASCGRVPGRSSPMPSRARRPPSGRCSGRTGRWTTSSWAIRRPAVRATSGSRRRERPDARPHGPAACRQVLAVADRVPDHDRL